MKFDPFTRAQPVAVPVRADLAFDFLAYLFAAGLPADTAPPVIVPLGRNDVTAGA